jgi:hypothetical protein
MIHTADRTITFVKLSDIANEYADKFHDRGTESHDDVRDEFLESVNNSQFAWGTNDATFVRLDRFCDEIPGAEECLDGAIVAAPSADIFVLLEE